jgi:hypothetical protein
MPSLLQFDECRRKPKMGTARIVPSMELFDIMHNNRWLHKYQRKKKLQIDKKFLQIDKNCMVIKHMAVEYFH